MDRKQLQFIKDNTSPTFCLAKFHESTIWLYSSKIASCHHTPLFSTGENIVNFYNNSPRRRQQESMLNGEKPLECNYCWRLEEQGLTSDRELKSLYFKSHLSPETYFNKTYDFKPKSLELAFQNTCNLACSYCSPSFSTEWIKDIKINGFYANLKSDVKKHYERGIDDNVPVDMNLFWEWFNTVASELESIRITGGEPLLHEETFDTFKKMQEINPNVECVIHTNLCQKPLVIQRFISSIQTLSNVRINISNESSNDIAEFIRDGMNYNIWLSNVNELITKTTATTSISTTITAASLIGLDQMYLDIIKLRNNPDVKTKPYISINIATYPIFQSLACLSRSDREFYLKKYTTFFNSIQSELLDQEVSAFNRLLSMLSPDLTHKDYQFYRNDYNEFFEQYTQRRNKPTNVAALLGKK